jgi:hypothetical protein
LQILAAGALSGMSEARAALIFWFFFIKEKEHPPASLRHGSGIFFQIPRGELFICDNKIIFAWKRLNPNLINNGNAFPSHTFNLCA